MGGGGTQKQTTEVKLSPEQRQLLNLAMPYAQNFANNPVQPVGVEPFNQNQLAGQTGALNSVDAQNQLAQSGAQGANFLLSGDALRPESNPALQGWMDAAVRPIYQNLTDTALPSVRGGAITAGGYGGSRQGIAEGLAIRSANDAAGSTTANIANQGYQAGLDAMTRAGALLPVYQSSQTAGAATQSAVGDVQRQMSEALRQAPNEQTYLDLMMARELASLVGGIPGGGSTTSASAPGTSPLGGALGGASAGMSIGGPWGALIGGGLGLFSSFL